MNLKLVSLTKILIVWCVVIYSDYVDVHFTILVTILKPVTLLKVYFNAIVMQEICISCH